MRRNKASQMKETVFPREPARSVVSFVSLALLVFLLVSLIGFDVDDPSWANVGVEHPAANWFGEVGAWVAYTLFFLGGYAAFLLPVPLAYLAFRQHQSTRGKPQGWQFQMVRFIGFCLFLFAVSGLATVHFHSESLPAGSGGFTGGYVARAFVNYFSIVGATIALLTVAVGAVQMLFRPPWLKMTEQTGSFVLGTPGAVRRFIRKQRETRIARQMRAHIQEKVSERRKRQKNRKTPKILPRFDEPAVTKQSLGTAQKDLFEGDKIAVPYQIPDVSVLDQPSAKEPSRSDESLQAMAQQLELKLSDFGIEAQVMEICPGPVITRFELLPAAGIKVGRIVALEKDLARALSVASVRVVEVIPGKPHIGIEVPAEERKTISLSELLRSDDYARSSSNLTLALGQDVAGSPVLADLAKMPHLLVAGTTGSGKSVAIHAMLMSLIFKASAREIRLVLVDPKLLELKVYDGIPHLLTPVITDMELAVNALRWAVEEMEQRYRTMAELGVRNINGFNRKIADAKLAGQPLRLPGEDGGEQGDILEHMPYVVVVIDEFADMMQIVGKRVEALIIRLSQKARAAGVHLILATQRPSVNVITGLIKANVPVRIAFQVSSKVDSRTILDQSGAQQLLGRGDMLFLKPGGQTPERVHGAYVSDQEVARVTKLLSRQEGPGHDINILRAAKSESHTKGGAASRGAGDDELYEEAVRVVTETRRASVSSVQRRLRIGYNRAANVVERMEAEGIVSEVKDNGQREVLVPPEDA